MNSDCSSQFDRHRFHRRRIRWEHRHCRTEKERRTDDERVFFDRLPSCWSAARMIVRIEQIRWHILHLYRRCMCQ